MQKVRSGINTACIRMIILIQRAVIVVFPESLHFVALGSGFQCGFVLVGDFLFTKRNANISKMVLNKILVFPRFGRTWRIIRQNATFLMHHELQLVSPGCVLIYKLTYVVCCFWSGAKYLLFKFYASSIISIGNMISTFRNGFREV